MSDAVVVITQDPPELIEVVGVGPQGAQGPQGVKGDVGDVNPEMYTLRDAAAASASSAAASASAASASQTAAAGSATSASSSASTATSQASTAASQAATATTKAGEAATSATAAAGSATSAENSSTTAANSAITSTTKAVEASNSATAAASSEANANAAAANAGVSAATANTKAGEAAGSAASALAIYGDTTAIQTAVQTAQAAASLAQGYAASASSVVQQDLSGITAQALHRSPNAITAQFIYDTSKDSDGGAWTEKCQGTSWYNEALAGKWLGPRDSEFNARNANSTVGAELVTNGGFDSGASWNLGVGWSIVDGSAVHSGANGYLDQSLAGKVTVGKTYRVFASFTGPSLVLAGGNLTSGNVTLVSNVETYVVAAGTGLFIFSGSSNSIDNISVREVTALNTASNDYFQLTTDGKFYRLWKNILRYSEQFDNAAWTKTGVTITPNSSTSPTGTLTAETASVTAGSNNYIVRDFGGESTNPRVFSVYILKSAGAPASYPAIAYNNASGQGRAVLLNTQTGAISDATGAPRAGRFYFAGGAALAAVEDAGTYWRLSLRTENNAARAVEIIPAYNTDGSVNPLTSGSASAVIWGAQVEYGSAATTYEAKTTEGSTTEIFRGNKAEFPRLAAIVAEAGNVTIYDLTEPGRPMWMRFVGDAVNGRNMMCERAFGTFVTALNGEVVAGCPQFDLYRVRFASDEGYQYGNTTAISGVFAGNISQRNEPRGFITGWLPVIADRAVNAVAMTVLPDAPIDPATGLRVPTIAVGTASGVSVIKHNGTVVSSLSTLGVGGVGFLGRTLVTNRNATNAVLNTYNDVGNLTSSFIQTIQFHAATSVPRQSDGTLSMAVSNERIALGRVTTGSGGASLIRPDRNTLTRALISEIRSNYNTGWMTGDIRRAYLSDVTAESISGTELVTNGTFDTDTTGWTSYSSATLSVVDGRLRVTNSAATSSGAGQGISTVIGKTYVVIGELVGSNCYLHIGTSLGSTSIIGRTIATATFTQVFVATSTTTWITLSNNNAAISVFKDFDNISVTETVLDRSYKAALANTFGTLTKSQLASGTSLVGYSGFSASNYLREPYSADLDFGTGEWNASAWVNVPATLPDANFPSVGSELWASQTPTIANNAGSVGVYNSGTLTMTNTGSTVDSYPRFYFNIGMNIGSRYRVSGTLSGDRAKVSRIRLSQAGVLNDISYNSATGVFSGVANAATVGLDVVTQLVAGESLTIDSISIREVGASIIADRAFSSGPRFRLGVTGAGYLTAEAFDGTTTRTVTTTAAYNTATWLKAEANYTTDGSLTIRVNGREVAATRGNPLLTLNNTSAVLTIGNSYALDAPFPGTIALLKLGATVPTQEQATFMYEQEKQLFRAGALSVLPDTGSVVDMAYDDATDRWVAVSAANESYWTGLVRNTVTPVPAGSYTKVFATSGIELAARSTTNPGVDVTIPAYGLREELVKRAEAAARLSKELAVYDYVGGFTGNTTSGSTAIASVSTITYPASYIGARISGSGIPANATIVAVSGTTIYISAAATATATGVSITFLDFELPVGMEAKTVMSAGSVKQEGSTKDYTRLYDGFVETIRFGTAPGATTWVQIQAQRITLQ